MPQGEATGEIPCSGGVDLFAFERVLWESGWELVAGVDEAGRGPLAGPVVACAVVFPKDCPSIPVNDSKKLSAAERLALIGPIGRTALSVGVAVVQQEAIDRFNILQATFSAMRQALTRLRSKPDLVIVDGRQRIPGLAFPQFPLVKGDARSASVAAASIVAKVVRDRIMEEMDETYPAYGFARHKGYATPSHRAALLRFGPSPVHRASFLKKLFAPVQERLAL